MENNMKRIRMEEFGWSLRELARRSKVHYITVGLVEKGASCRELTMYKIAAALGSEVHEVFPEYDPDDY
jgi:DNA-binding XRE family transcriptional regulator